MNTVYLHIGTHKTGTTYLQTILAANRQHLLSLGYYFPKAAIPSFTPGHHMLAWAIQDGDFRIDPATGTKIDLRNAWPDLLQELHSCEGQNIIISSEYFSRLASKEQIQKVKEYLLDYDVKINICLRRQDQYLLSEYSERVKTGYGRSFQSFVKERKHICNYAKCLDDWESVFGQDNISVRLFQKEKKRNDKVIQEFFHQIGLGQIDTTRLKLSDRRFNVSPSSRQLRILRWLNVFFLDFLSLPKSFCWNFYLRPLLGRRPKKIIELIPNFLIKDRIVTEVILESILTEFESVNQEIASKYFPQKLKSLF